MKKPKNRENPKDPFYPREKRHVRGMKTNKNKKNAKVHPALIVGEKKKKFISMGMTTTAPKNSKQRKKVIPLSQLSKDGKKSYLLKHIREGNKSSYSIETYPEYKFSDKEHAEIDKCVEKKRRFIHDHEGEKRSSEKKKDKKERKNNL